MIRQMHFYSILLYCVIFNVLYIACLLLCLSLILCFVLCFFIHSCCFGVIDDVRSMNEWMNYTPVVNMWHNTFDNSVENMFQTTWCIGVACVDIAFWQNQSENSNSIEDRPIDDTRSLHRKLVHWRTRNQKHHIEGNAISAGCKTKYCAPRVELITIWIVIVWSIWHKVCVLLFTFWKISTPNLRIFWCHLPTELRKT